MSGGVGAGVECRRLVEVGREEAAGRVYLLAGFHKEALQVPHRCSS